MKNSLLLLFLFLACVTGGKAKNATKSEISKKTEASSSNGKSQVLTVDVTKKYPKSDRICLQDIADVEYVPLETTSDFLCESSGVSYIDNSLIIYNNKKNGDILFFDRKGKAKYKINRKGQSGEEYITANRVIYDKDAEELYVNDMMQKKIVVYNLKGKYKRSFKHIPGSQYSNIYLYNNQYLLCYDEHPDGFEKETHPFKVISKMNGKLITNLDIPFSKRISYKFFFTEGSNTQMFFPDPQPESAVKNGNQWILNEISSDTIYQLSNDFHLTPVMAQIPSVQSMGENPTYIVFVLDSYHYQFMYIQKKEFDKKTRTGFPITATIVYDKKTGKINEQNFYDANRPDKSCDISFNKTINSSAYFDLFPANRLKGYLEKKQLTGQLKEIAERIGEDENPVLMIVTFKK